MNSVPIAYSTALTAAAQTLAVRGWLRATSGNLSMRDATSDIIYITRSGVDKQCLTPSDLIGITSAGSVIAGEGKPSFETAVHQAIYRLTPAGAVLHVHTVHNNLASRFASPRGLTLTGSEMLKALGHWAEGAHIVLPVVPNYADIERLATAVGEVLNPDIPGILVNRHGIYAFGNTLPDAVHHLEAWEFLFEWLCLERAAQASDYALAAPGSVVP